MVRLKAERQGDLLPNDLLGIDTRRLDRHEASQEVEIGMEQSLAAAQERVNQTMRDLDAARMEADRVWRQFVATGSTIAPRDWEDPGYEEIRAADSVARERWVKHLAALSAWAKLKGR